eukprot:756934-Pyramimonas_sp.AAC.1
MVMVHLTELELEMSYRAVCSSSRREIDALVQSIRRPNSITRAADELQSCLAQQSDGTYQTR